MPGIPGTAMALAPLAYLLYRETMHVNPANPYWEDRDRFVLSAGHACVLQYTTLHLTGFNLAMEELKRFRQWESLTPGHPEHFLTPGIETTTGPLGQGMSNAVGMAMAEKFLAQRYNRPRHEVVDHRTYVIASDGDLMEGVSAEASLARRRLRARQAHRLLRRQPDHDRRHDGALLRPRGQGRALRGLRLARPGTWRT